MLSRLDRPSMSGSGGSRSAVSAGAMLSDAAAGIARVVSRLGGGVSIGAAAAGAGLAGRGCADSDAAGWPARSAAALSLPAVCGAGAQAIVKRAAAPAMTAARRGEQPEAIPEYVMT
jgi:hypothetical protein